MTVRTPDSGFESLALRYDRVQRFLPYLLLTVPLIPYVLSQNPSAGAVGITVGIAVAAGAWSMWMINLHPAWAMAKKIATGAQPIHRHGPDRYRKACRKPNQVKKANHGLRMVSTPMNAISPVK